MRGLDWPGLIRAGLVGLKLKPAEFWALTPAELLMMLGLEGADAPMARNRLEELSRAYPDAEKGRADG
ncbi:rcc01693 family protein [Aestuariibius sp. HNIBRBA575]|uniref:rcc01693 family protein n=1 Tax=Aestuariibius sp. HNIBRBA575 TaxID=3233343 RepID=UPI0034A3EDBD